jgi:hypothetical protein
MIKNKDSPLAPQQIAKHPPDQYPPHMKRLDTATITVQVSKNSHPSSGVSFDAITTQNAG